MITEKRLAEAISLDPSYLRDTPHLVTLLAVFQERDDFNVDSENGVVKPVHEDTFLKETMDKVLSLSSQQSLDPPIELEQCREQLGDIKNQLLDSVKQRWIRPGKRDSICSLASNSSKRDRGEDNSVDRASWLKVLTSPSQ